MSQFKEKVSINNLLVKKSGKSGVFIKGTRISVNFIARCWRTGYGAEEIISEYPNIPTAGVYAALAYYFVNREVLDAEIDAEIDTEKRLKFKYTEFRNTIQKEAA